MEKTISSVEISKMVRRKHQHVMRDIRQLLEHLGGLSKFGQTHFVESFYCDGQGREMPCYFLTKKGCELYATRLSGAKGTRFAAAYIERFYQLEAELADQLDYAEDELDYDEDSELFSCTLDTEESFRSYDPEEKKPCGSVAVLTEEPAGPIINDQLPARDQLRLFYQFSEDTANRVDFVETRLQDYEENAVIDAGSYALIGKRVNQRVSEVAASYRAHGKTQRRRLYIDINQGVKTIAGVGARSQLRKKHFDEVMDFINNWEPSSTTRALLKKEAEED